VSDTTAELDVLVERYPDLASCRDEIAAVAALLSTTLAANRFLFVCGNGGSACDAEHIVGELLKKFTVPRPLPAAVREALLAQDVATGEYLVRHLEQGLRAIALTGHLGLSTAMANDVAAELVFAQQVLAWGSPGDVLLGLSTSGNAANVCHAMRVARAKGLTVVGLTGLTGGRMLSLCDLAIRAPATETARIQEFHLPIYHVLCRLVEQACFAAR
jgi:phosphoheptose isomerase